VPPDTDAAVPGAEGAGAACDVDILTVGPFQSNCYVVRPAGEGPAVVVDPGDEPERILAKIGDEDVAAILLTHAHLDHVGAVAAVARATGAPIYLHPGDRFLYDAAEEHARVFGVRVEAPPPPDEELAGGDELKFGDLEFSVRHVPGHSPGHVIFVTDGMAFVGDCVFAGSIGRTDLPGGDMPTLLAAIREHILTLPPDTVLYPGHMGPTTVRREGQTNPFLIQGGFGRGGFA
jgi:glyoxylase-like metal-dependent hydrolase (beta-lactamase superfamily II)